MLTLFLNSPLEKEYLHQPSDRFTPGTDKKNFQEISTKNSNQISEIRIFFIALRVHV